MTAGESTDAPSTAARGASTTLDAFVRRYLTWREHEPDEEAAFDHYARAYCVRASEWFCAAFLAFLPVYYVVDVVALGPGDALRDSVRWRLAAGALLAVGVAGARTMRVTGRDALAYPLGIAGGVAISAVIGITTASSAPLGSVTTSAFLLLPLCAVPMVSRLWLRAVTTVLVGVAVLGGYFWQEPTHLTLQGAGYFSSVMAFACFLSVAIGHALSQQVRQSFFLARRLAENARVLDARVQARTQEIRALLTHVVEAREDERARISREVHDELGQLLGGAALSLDRARALADDAERRAELARAREIVSRAMGAARTVVTELRPRLLDDMDLAAAVEWLVREHEQSTGVDCAWTIDVDTARVAAPHATVLFRVLQEALTNCARHARAESVTVLLEGTDAALSLDVRDDGVGFTPGAPGVGAFGLRGMHERARALGGTLRVESAPGLGTRVLLTLPWEGSPS
ncbi:MAG: sensor histidine kinase [Polyangiales bacterium]